MRFLLILAILLGRAASSAADDSDPDPRLLIHLLDYLAKDYGAAVSGGRVTDPNEYAEQVEFSDLAMKAARSLLDTAAATDLRGNLSKLKSLIDAKADAATVAALAREIQAAAVRVSGIDVSPERWPDRNNGKALFASNCAACHGMSGRGDGPAAESLRNYLRTLRFLAA